MSREIWQSRPLSKIKTRKVHWLLKPFIPIGFITTIAGDGEVGKTTMIYDLLARITVGDPMPVFGGEPPGEDPMKGSIVLLSKEDDAGLMMKPRLRAAGADMKKVHIISKVKAEEKDEIEVIGRLDNTMGDVERIIGDLGDVRALVIDPVPDFAGETNLYREEQVRRFLQPIGRLAARHGIAVITVLHLIKDTKRKARQRILGSAALVNVPRSVLIVGKSNGRRYLMMEKANLWADKKSVAFAIDDHEGQPVVEWDADWEDVDIEDVLASKSIHITKQQQAGFKLRAWLAEGPKPARAAERLAEEAGFHFNTFKAAKKEIGIISEKRDDGWWWALPQEDKQDGPEDNAPVRRERLN